MIRSGGTGSSLRMSRRSNSAATCPIRTAGTSIAVKEGPRRAGDPPALVASAAKAREVLGWRPRYTELRPIVETAWNWHRTHPKGYNDRRSV